MFDHYIFIMSTAAAHGKNLPEEKVLREIFAKQGIEDRLQIVHTTYPRQPRDVAQELGEKYGNTAVIYGCGGDGTLNEVMQGIYGTGAYMGALPCGTANDFCKTIYRDLSYDTLLSRTPSPTRGVMDLVQIDDALFLNVASFGLDSIVLEKAYDNLKRHPKMGTLAYGLAVLQSMFKEKNFAMSYDLETPEGERLQGTDNYSLGALCNGGFYGSGFNPSPLANVHDGKLELVLARTLSLTEFISLIGKYRKGRHLGHPKIELFSVVKGKLTMKQKSVPANYDGELFSLKEICFEILPGVLPFAYL